MSYTATLSGPSYGGLGIPAQFTVSLSVAAGSGGQAVGLSSTQGSDVFKVSLSGSSVSGITIPSGSTSGTFWFIPSSTTGARDITFTASGAVIAYGYGGTSFTYTEGTVAGQYFSDSFTGSANSLLTSHTSDSGASWPNSTYNLLGSASLELDGNGMVFPTVGTLNGQIPSVALPYGNFEINYTAKDYGSKPYSSGGVTIFASVPYGQLTSQVISLVSLSDSGAHGTNWFTGGFGYSNTPGFSGTVALIVGTLYHFKIQAFAAYGSTTLYLYYSTDGTNWLTPLAYSKTSFTTPSYPLSVGPVFSETHGGSGWTATTGIHIGSLSIGKLALASPTSSVDHAYVSTSGESVAIFFKNSGGTAKSAQFVVDAPTFYKNGVTMGDLSGLVPWINTSALPMIFPLPSAVASTDVITMSASSSWVLLSDQSTVNSVSGFAVANNVGKSCFGTDTLTKTLKVGVNASSIGCMYGGTDNGVAFNNLLFRCNLLSLPSSLGSSVQNYTFMQTTDIGSHMPASFGTPGPLGYYAIGYDDAYVSNGGSPTGQLKITSLGLPTVVTQITSCDNHGTNGIGQYYLFQVTSTSVDSSGHPSFSVNLNLTYPVGSGATYVTNLFILGPGEFTFTLGTPLTFDRSQPLVVANSFKAAIPSGVGSMRFEDSLNYLSQAVDPWEVRGEHDTSWNSNTFSSSFNITGIRPFVTSTSPYIYGDHFGSSWTASSSPLASAMNNSQTTITMSAAQTECNGNPLFYGLTLGVGGQGGSGTLEYMRVISVSGTSVTVVRGFAFGGVNTSAVAHGVGENITIGKRYAWTTLASLGSFFGGAGHQTVEVVCDSPHKMHSGQRWSMNFASSYPVNDTNGHQIVGMDVLCAMITGPKTFMVSVWANNGAYNAYSAATVASAYTFPTPLAFSFGLPNGQIPYEAACYLANYYNCNIHLPVPLLASDGLIYQKANAILSKLTPGKEVVIELCDEPGNYYWVQWVESAFSALANGSGGSSIGFLWYCMRINQINTIFASVFNAAGRGNELKRFVNCAGNNSIMSTLQHNVPPIKTDYMGMAPYIIADSGAPSSVFDNNATLNQAADAFIHQVFYLAATASFNTGIIGNQFADQNSIMATYNNATGYNCKIYGYEGGYQTGSSVNSSGPKNANGWYNWRLSSDIRYLPVWRIYEKDFFAMCQTGGYTTLSLYAMYLYPSYQSCWEVMGWIGQQLGTGDGTDGKFDNRKAMQTAGLSGPYFYTAGYIGAGVGTVSVVHGSGTVTFSQAWTITPGKSYITVDDDNSQQQYFLISGSGVGPWTIYLGVSPPGNNTYQGPTNAAATYIYGIAMSQDMNTVSVRGQALAEWNSSTGVISNHYTVQFATGIG